MQGSDGNADIRQQTYGPGEAGEGEGGTNGASSRETYPLPYVKQRASGNVLCDPGNSNQSSVTTSRGGMAWEVGGRVKREGHMYTYG